MTKTDSDHNKVKQIMNVSCTSEDHQESGPYATNTATPQIVQTDTPGDFTAFQIHATSSGINHF